MRISEIKNIIKTIVSLLVSKEYKLLIDLDFAKIVSVEDVEAAIAEFESAVSTPPEYAFDNMYLFPTSDKNLICVDFRLWIDSVESDLTLLVNIKRTESGKYVYSITGIRVL